MLAERIQEKLAALSFKPNERKAKKSSTQELAENDDDRMDDSISVPESTGVRVIVRCRPLLKKDESPIKIAADRNGKEKASVNIDIPPGVVEKPSYAEDLKRFRASGQRSFRCNSFFGPEASQEDIFEAASPILDRTMEGYNGTVFCYGVTGSGKTYTMTGPPEDNGARDRDDNAGIVQRTARRIFEYIRDRSIKGEVFVVEASFLEICSNDGTREELVDLLAEDNRKLEVKQDPLNLQSFICDGLRKVPIRSPDEMLEVLKKGQARCTYMETTRNCHSSRSHCLFMLNIESLAAHADMSEPIVQRGKLMLVDLAGSESLKKVQASSDANEELRKKQAIGINRVLSSLGTVVNNMNIGLAGGHRDSALTMLLRDCLGGNSRALLIANIGSELEYIDESAKTLMFAQQMMAVKNVASVNRIEQDQSSLLQMRQRHADCIRILQEKVSDTVDEELEERRRLKEELEDLNKRLLTKDSAEQTLEEMAKEQFIKIDEMKLEMTQAMSTELEKMRKQSLQDLDNLRASVEEHVSNVDKSRYLITSEENETKWSKLQVDLQEAIKALRTTEEEASDLRVRLASTEERARMLQMRQEEVKKERADFDEERRSLRQQGEQQWQRLSKAEGELQKYRAEAEVQRNELARLNDLRTEDTETIRREREAWRLREAELQREIVDLQRQLDERKRDADLKGLRAEAERQQTEGSLRLQLEKLEAEVSTRADQLVAAQKTQALLQEEKEAMLEREKTAKEQFDEEMKKCKEELEEAARREQELMVMLNEVQDSIITASSD
mmetsp:Transcript_30325/g.66360  ORF Transcript_30325/g.66360 Transcript_30325/m.66360 type:complete len:786 (+) Transcript_30325:91-2448(+)|eukprot:CAMPEP_0170601008 /NCGR_PEP_ID=MMETSP0224-20130122/17631_1 /TAXON_ID=285029 /ORGANISM="Togula jolla, Strain CCCM 725" /LENGTH=785 /DNA_ID=CAMNT_0010925757 /DNA_START=75 /DNA_END=2432 /DNA_ORIENTATION=-